ncbi:hypothetical protein NL676_008485 [Syzygium grande]|nr:hypothetical protein NL676_008485 [Syzygium grande]
MEGGIGESEETRSVGGAAFKRHVENGKLLRSLKPHVAAMVCLNGEEEVQVNGDTSGNSLAFEDGTTCLFPPAPRVPCMPGLVLGETGLIDDGQDSLVELSNSLKPISFAVEIKMGFCASVYLVSFQLKML